MCGIVGYVGPKPLLPVLMEGLRRLEYRGYDSAGVAVVRGGQMHIRRSAGKLSNLDDVLLKDPVDGQFGIGHTRWATRGRHSRERAHAQRVCWAGIRGVQRRLREIYLALKGALRAGGSRCVADRDAKLRAHRREGE